MAQLEIHPSAVGPCMVCGADRARSNYWVAMTDEQWAVVLPLVAHLFPDDDHIMKSALFIPPLDRPLCSPQCSLKWYRQEEINDDTGTR